MVGKLSAVLDKGFVFQLIPTPLNDAGEPACSLVGIVTGSEDKKRGSASKGKAAQADGPVIVVDTDWVAEHARQVPTIGLFFPLLLLRGLI